MEEEEAPSLNECGIKQGGGAWKHIPPDRWHQEKIKEPFSRFTDCGRGANTHPGRGRKVLVREREVSVGRCGGGESEESWNSCEGGSECSYVGASERMRVVL